MVRLQKVWGPFSKGCINCVNPVWVKFQFPEYETKKETGVDSRTHQHLKELQTATDTLRLFHPSHRSNNCAADGVAAELWLKQLIIQTARMKTSISSKAFLALLTYRRTKYLQNWYSFVRGICTEKNWSDISFRGREKRGWHTDGHLLL